ncbi:TnpV protein [Ruminococcus sp. NSJ-71]|uniref:TnpV protein n=1 Tax=Ruminococcus intestinalis TaxID=2763066 RepID=A0ABR7HK05_9FIRM|nr:TnpV protein [Ruminococcus intestinalis]
MCEQCGKEFYPNSTRQRFCNTDCTKAHQQAEAMFSRLVKQLSEKESVTEALKAENQMLWVQRLNNIRSAAMEIVSSELIYC